MRSFIRHPVDIPIQLEPKAESISRDGRTNNVSVGGLSCQSDHPIPIGHEVDISIPVLPPPFQARGCVVWCEPRNDGSFDVGIEFHPGSDAFKVRMIEQVCHIEQYRKDVLRTEGRDLDSAAAALEWIHKHAADFPA